MTSRDEHIIDMFRMLDETVNEYYKSCAGLDACHNALVIANEQGPVTVGKDTRASAHGAVWECARHVGSRIVGQIPEEARTDSVEASVDPETGEIENRDALLRHAPRIAKETANLAIPDDLRAQLEREYALALQAATASPEGLLELHQQTLAVLGALRRISEASASCAPSKKRGEGGQAPGQATVQEQVNDYVASALRYHHVGRDEDTDGELINSSPLQPEQIIAELRSRLPGRTSRTLGAYVSKAFSYHFGRHGGKPGFAIYKIYCEPQFNWKLRYWFLGESKDVVYGSMSTEQLASKEELQKRVARQDE